MAAASTVAAIAAVVAIAAGGTTAACSSFSSEGTSPDLASEAGSDACADGSCVSLDGCAGKILYVRPNGDDANNGCDSALPKKTIGSAISTLRILSRVDFEVRVCKGEYRENGLTLDFPVKLFGGYECSTGIREASYGYPTFGAANESVLAVTDGGNATSTITATLVGKPVDAVVVDGLRIRAPSHSTLHTTAVNVAVGASATFSNDVIEGASTGARTTGVFLDRGRPSSSRTIASRAAAELLRRSQGSASSEAPRSTPIKRVR